MFLVIFGGVILIKLIFFSFFLKIDICIILFFYYIYIILNGVYIVVLILILMVMKTMMIVRGRGLAESLTVIRKFGYFSRRSGRGCWRGYWRRLRGSVIVLGRIIYKGGNGVFNVCMFVSVCKLLKFIVIYL